MSDEMMTGKQKQGPLGSSASGSPPVKLNIRRLENIQRVLQYGSGLVLIVFIVLIGYSVYKLNNIRKEIAEQQKALEIQKAKIKENETELSLQQQTISSQRGVISGLSEANFAAGQDDQKQGEQIKDRVEANIPQNIGIEQIPPRIYIQIAREDQRKRAAQVARKLQAEGYIVPGIENVGDKSPNVSGIRYCQTTRVSQKDIDGMTSILESLSMKLSKAQLLRNCGASRPRHYELWFGKEY